MTDISLTKQTLSKKVSRGVAWVGLSTLISRVLGIVSSVLITRLLLPEDFGLMAMAIAVISFSQGSTQTGFESALVQIQDEPERLFNSAWTMELIRNVILATIIVSSAPLLSQFFEEPRLIPLVRFLSLSFVFLGLKNIGVVFFRKQLDFHKIFLLETVPVLVYIITLITLAVILRSVWALVIASVVSHVTICIVSYLIHPFRPRLEFNLRKTKELFSFGKWILGSSILVMIREQGVTMFIGKILGVTILGFFNRANAFSTVLFQQITEAVWKIGFPLLSGMQNRKDVIRETYLKISQLLTFIGFPIAGGLFILSHDFTLLFLSEKWLPIVPMMQLFCIQGLLIFVNTPAGILFQAIGKPGIGVRISFLGSCVLLVIVYPLTLKFHEIGVVLAMVISLTISTPFIWVFAMKALKCQPIDFFKPFCFAFMNSAIMVFTVYGVKTLVTEINLLVFVLLILCGITSYGLTSFLSDRFLKYGIYSTIYARLRAIYV
jgi:lipopolysaccharide exporter